MKSLCVACGILAIVVACSASDVPAKGGIVDGEIVRVVGQKEMVIRVGQGREDIILHVSPQTVYMYDDLPGQFDNFQPGVKVRAWYNARQNSYLAHRIASLPKR